MIRVEFNPTQRTKEKIMSSDNADLIMKRYSDEAILRAAFLVMEKKVNYNSVFDSPHVVKDFLRIKQGASEHEQFSVLFLDSQHRLISCETMFEGTISQTAVYPREIVKRALQLNSSAIMLCHNHPSGSLQESHADVAITKHIKEACSLLDIRVLDHFIVSVAGVSSLAEKGLV
jgi:DNA repair protein RadC